MYRNIECCVIGTNSVVCPTSEVRGRSWEDPMPEGWRPKGVTPRPRSGAVAQSTRLQRRRNGREELPYAPMPEARGGGREELPHAPSPRPGATGGRSYPQAPTPKARGGGREDQPHFQGAVAARVQEGLEELSHIEGQEGWQ